MTKRYIPQKPNDEKLLREDIARLVSKYGRYGYRRITACQAPNFCTKLRVSISAFNNLVTGAGGA